MSRFIKLTQQPTPVDGALVSRSVWINPQRIFAIMPWEKKIYNPETKAYAPIPVTSIFSGDTSGEDSFSFEVIETPDEILALISALCA